MMTYLFWGALIGAICWGCAASLYIWRKATSYSGLTIEDCVAGFFLGLLIGVVCALLWPAVPFAVAAGLLIWKFLPKAKQGR